MSARCSAHAAQAHKPRRAFRELPYDPRNAALAFVCVSIHACTLMHDSCVYDALVAYYLSAILACGKNTLLLVDRRAKESATVELVERCSKRNKFPSIRE